MGWGTDGHGGLSPELRHPEVPPPSLPASPHPGNQQGATTSMTLGGVWCGGGVGGCVLPPAVPQLGVSRGWVTPPHPTPNLGAWYSLHLLDDGALARLSSPWKRRRGGGDTHLSAGQGGTDPRPDATVTGTTQGPSFLHSGHPAWPPPTAAVVPSPPPVTRCRATPRGPPGVAGTRRAACPPGSHASRPPRPPSAMASVP